MEKLKTGEFGKIKGINVKCVSGDKCLKNNCERCVFKEYHCADVMCNNSYYINNK